MNGYREESTMAKECQAPLLEKLVEKLRHKHRKPQARF